MTLVVARKFDEHIALVGDTQVSNAANGRFGLLEGNVKCVVMAPVLAIAFAGDIQGAAAVLEQGTKKWMRGTREQMIADVLSHHITSKGATEFILAFLAPSEIVLIKNCTANRNVQTAWIGENAGFEAYQRAYHATNPLLSNSSFLFRYSFTPHGFPNGEIGRMLKAMDEVTVDQTLPTIGGLAIVVNSTSAGFCYAEHVSIGGPFRGKAGQDTIEVVPKGAPRGQCTVFASFGLSADGAVQLPLTYFAEAHLLLVHPIRPGMVPRRIRAHSFDEALHRLQEKAQYYCRTRLPHQYNLFKQAPNLAKDARNPDIKTKTIPHLEWRAGARTPLSIENFRVISIQFSNLTEQHAQILRQEPLDFINLEGNERYTLRDLYFRVVFEYEWIPSTLSHPDSKEVVVIVPCEGPSKNRFMGIARSERGGPIGLTKLIISADIRALA